MIHQDDAGKRHEVDHVIAEKHGGETVLENLCLACFLCNRNKGSDIASYTATGALTPFFHPRQQKWHEHLVIRGNRIEPLAGGGEVTVRLLAFNTPDLCEEREGLQEIGRYPSGGDPI